MKQIKFKHACLLLSIWVLAACKKYPENTLWFKNPKKIYPLQGYITKYEVDGVDSLDHLSKFYGTLQGLPNDIRQSRFVTTGEGKDLDVVFVHGNSGASSSVSFEFSKNKKKIYMSLPSDLDTYTYDFFFRKEWDILYLDKKGKFRIKTQYNNKTYLIEID